MSEGNRYNTKTSVVRPDAKREITVRPMSEAESAAIQANSRAGLDLTQRIQMPELDSTHTGHVRHVDDPVTNAKASLLYSVAYIIVVFIALLAMLIITDIADGDGFVFFGLLIGGTSFFALGILSLNRRQGLHHSATGISHHEIEARERMHATNAEVEIERIRQAGEVAKYAIASTSRLMQKRWQIESGKDAE